jgi:hypothetical protein
MAVNNDGYRGKYKETSVSYLEALIGVYKDKPTNVTRNTRTVDFWRHIRIILTWPKTCQQHQRLSPKMMPSRVFKLIFSYFLTSKKKVQSNSYVHRDFRPLRYSSRNGHIKVEHVNRKRDSPSFCPTLQVLDMSILGDISNT